jgi:hypothetical protein
VSPFGASRHREFSAFDLFKSVGPLVIAFPCSSA